MGKFVISKTKNGEFTFSLKAGNGEIILTASESYTSMSGCQGGIASVQKNALAHVEDQTVEGFEELFGRPADKRRKLYNGMMKCQLYLYFPQRRGKAGD